ncbi:hypothetical protein [Brevibacillus brevis]|uniref:Uncharacterized protein n=1 Tax=Brevibacillus brevis TaxID=1393 RepID=A0ABY9SWN6_BREBE|nr:hypothetical protein [Brevibacillus brevis]WNC12240.1 hypothetical protein RGB73_15985 [Brevibacillus brevis]
MLKKWLKSLMGQHSSSHHYRKFSSSDHNYRKGHGYPNDSGYGRGHSYYGSSHYKKKRSSRSFFSS